MMDLRHISTVVAALLLGLLTGSLPAAAHPMGNFSINHYSRFTIHKNRLTLLFVLDMAEIPTITERNEMGADRDGKTSEAERNAYLTRKIQQVRNNLLLLINDRPADPTQSLESLEFRPGAGGLDTLRVTFTLNARLPDGANGCRVFFKDSNYAERTGWKEIVATTQDGTRLEQSTASSIDISRALTIYPADPTIAAPQQDEAEFTIRGNGFTVGRAPTPGRQPLRPAMGPNTGAPASGSTPTPQDGFTQVISREDLTPSIVLVSLGLAILFGAFHALSPGHGKAMVAAYLVGSRGTVRHAVFLGGVITLAHTISVYVLGLVTLVAAQYIVPDRLYPVLSFASGAAIVCVGVALLWQRHTRFREERREKEEAGGFGEWDEQESAGSPLPPDAPVSLKSLIVLGVTGGALPCPSALVVMLGAIALHRIAFGLALICAFSLGLASILTLIGILVVRLRHMLERLPLHDRYTSRLPIMSALLVTLVGLVLIVRALHGQF